jgi:hypothetical protein
MPTRVGQVCSICGKNEVTALSYEFENMGSGLLEVVPAAGRCRACIRRNPSLCKREYAEEYSHFYGHKPCIISSTPQASKQESTTEVAEPFLVCDLCHASAKYAIYAEKKAWLACGQHLNTVVCYVTDKTNNSTVTIDNLAYKSYQVAQGILDKYPDEFKVLAEVSPHADVIQLIDNIPAGKRVKATLSCASGWTETVVVDPDSWIRIANTFKGRLGYLMVQSAEVTEEPETFIASNIYVGLSLTNIIEHWYWSIGTTGYIIKYTMGHVRKSSFPPNKEVLNRVCAQLKSKRRRLEKPLVKHERISPLPTRLFLTSFMLERVASLFRSYGVADDEAIDRACEILSRDKS